MRIYRIYPTEDGERQIEEVDLAKSPELKGFMHVAQVGIHEFPELRLMDFHPLTERRLIIHLQGEVEIEVSDGGKQIFRPGYARLLEAIHGKGHHHQALSPVIQAVVVLADYTSLPYTRLPVCWNMAAPS